MGDQLAASGCISVADCCFMFRLCGAGDQTADEKNRETVHCGYHKAAAVTHILGNIVDSFPEPAEMAVNGVIPLSFSWAYRFFSDAQCYMSFIKIGAVMVFSKDGAEGFITFSDIAPYDIFFISHALEFAPVLCMLAGIISIGKRRNFDTSIFYNKYDSAGYYAARD